MTFCFLWGPLRSDDSSEFDWRRRKTSPSLCTAFSQSRKGGKRLEKNSMLMLASFFDLFGKNSSYVSGLSVCIFVALSVWMCVAGANKVEGTMSWLLGTNAITALKVKQGHFETAILVLYNFVLRVHILVWLLVQDIYDLVWLSRTAHVQRTWIMFHLL